mgnify:FL=1
MWLRILEFLEKNRCLYQEKLIHLLILEFLEDVRGNGKTLYKYTPPTPNLLSLRRGYWTSEPTTLNKVQILNRPVTIAPTACRVSWCVVVPLLL